jgi:hypothetical protein
VEVGDGYGKEEEKGRGRKIEMAGTGRMGTKRRGQWRGRRG